ncbi:radical SAM protein [Candidatus Woesearchaeota archaeon]|nr:radical SAM protein [Candidatus Woesearchaeota archaeon]
MKKSIYNIVLDTNKRDMYLMFNTLNNSTIVIDKEVLDLMECPNSLRNKNSKIFENLVRLGFLVNDHVNEKKIFQFKYYQQRFASQKSEIMISTTYACNLACPYCFEGKHKKSEYLKEPLLFNIISFIKKISKLNNSKKLEIHLFGGEPLLNRYATFKILNLIKKWTDTQNIDFKFILYTNGTLASKNIVDKIKIYKNNIKYIQITLDGPKEIHDNQRYYKSKKGSYDKIIETLKIFKKEKIWSVLRINIDKNNYLKIPELLDDLKSKEVGDIPIGFGFIREMTSSCGKIPHQIVNPNKVLIKLWEISLKKGFNISVKPKTGLNYCGAFKNSSFVIDVKGYVYKCAGLQGIKEHAIGKIDDSGNIPALGYRYYDFLSRDPLSMKKCKDCVNLPICGGGCASFSFTNFGTYHHANCFNKSLKLTKEGLKLYFKYKGPKKFRDLF